MTSDELPKLAKFVIGGESGPFTMNVPAELVFVKPEDLHKYLLQELISLLDIIGDGELLDD